MTKITETTRPLKAKEITHQWHLIDIGGKILGRTTQEIARLLQGKHKVQYVPYLDNGDHVVVINASKVVLTGKKADNKKYTYYSGYPSGLRTETFLGLIKRRPEEVIRHAVTGMLPKNKLRDNRLARLHVFDDDKHPFEQKLKVKS
ncbi:50S ribosomal protein L13 [Candidatus Roizmanbacteria bacterium RIFCSPHIGHO2_12_FULL_41_11]|uniref:Large ribosomal subunit protein uL13 n=3 Tax=Candidatus Roizmaniibacteriota TaxID=1752723 RepID=A0A1F7JS59_9BACT|nr:MAG: 50S ribosomal protein L13 [Candidatus Roizmanbacteria bacterium RIFCSPHIGHO2_12_FULL_41_11]OGK51346.1 MAG: 50S ribosomal protein L13 [Candidatus Roizmanbacteria bacterium RIFCSPLOWO2_01_FULL_41_22]OGK58438.1 MAG: 50S ribosomal protein L13 [Candidatus Roizmanbacteria bacterium RIFCSPLOWO2_02_FULL_41_9]